MRQFLEADTKQAFARSQEAVVAGDVAGRQPGDLCAHGGGVAAVVEHRPVVEPDAIERRNGHQRDIVGQALAAQGPQLLEEEGRGDDGGPCVEREAIDLVYPRPAARLGKFLEHRDAIAAGAEPYSGGQAAEAAADDQRVRAALRIDTHLRVVAAGSEECRGREVCQHGVILIVSIKVDNRVPPRVWSSASQTTSPACVVMFPIASGAAFGTQVDHPSLNPADLSLLSGLAPELAAAFASLAGEIALVIDDSGVIRNVALGAETPGHRANDWVGKRWVETVTDSTRRKIEMLLSDVAELGVTRRREVNHPASEGGDDIPVSYAALRLGPAGPVIAVGRDLRAVAAIQQRIVDARQEMERDYWKMRQEQTRQRLLTQVASDAVMVVDALSLEIRQSNAGAASLFGTSGSALAEPIREVLAMAARTGRAAEVRTRLAPGAGLIDLSATPLRLVVDGAETLGLLVRARGAVEEGVSPEGAAIVIADTSGRVRVANDAFRQLCHAGTASIDGRSLVEMLGDPQRHLAAMLVEARRVGLVQRPAVLLGGGADPTYEIHATATLIADGDQECIGLVLQRFELSQGDTLAAALATLVENVGATPLAELMQRASEAAERAAVETALRRAADDLRAAAVLLGISDGDLAQRLLRLPPEGGDDVTPSVTDSPAFGQANLTNCERELIHFAGSVQPHGLLFTLSVPELCTCARRAPIPGDCSESTSTR